MASGRPCFKKSFIQSRTREDFIQKPWFLSIGFEVDRGVRSFAGEPGGGPRGSRARVLCSLFFGQKSSRRRSSRRISPGGDFSGGPLVTSRVRNIREGKHCPDDGKGQFLQYDGEEYDYRSDLRSTTASAYSRGGLGEGLGGSRARVLCSLFFGQKSFRRRSSRRIKNRGRAHETPEAIHHACARMFGRGCRPQIRSIKTEVFV